MKLNNIFVEMLIDFVSLFIGVDLKEVKKSLDKKSLKDSGNLEISENIDNVSKKLEESKEIIENALLEIEKQKKLFEEMKNEAEISQQISSMNQEQVYALNKVLESTLNKQDKETSWKNVLLNLVFSVLGAVLGFVLGKIFP